jgi:hypothetical protein
MMLSSLVFSHRSTLRSAVSTPMEHCLGGEVSVVHHRLRNRARASIRLRDAMLESRAGVLPAFRSPPRRGDHSGRSGNCAEADETLGVNGEKASNGSTLSERKAGEILRKEIDNRDWQKV